MNQRIRKKMFKRRQLESFAQNGHVIKSKDFCLGNYRYTHGGLNATGVDSLGKRYTIAFALMFINE